MSVKPLNQTKSNVAQLYRVLLIDDDYVSFLYFKEIFESLNIQVQRITSLNSELFLSLQNVACIFINSRTISSDEDENKIQHLRNSSHTPVLLLTDQQRFFGLKNETVKCADFIISHENDPEQIKEIINECVL